MSDATTQPFEIEVDRPDLMVPLDDIAIPATRLREMDEAWAAAIGASFEDKGQDTAIIVRPTQGEKPYELVAGLHRLGGAASVKWSMIRCTVRDLDDHEARLVEIDENLMRRELHVLDRAIFLAERKRLYEAGNPSTKHGGDPKSKVEQAKSQTLRLGILPPRFTEDAAAKTGFSERSIQLAVQLATSLDEEAVRVIRGLPIADNQSALMALSKETPVRQRMIADHLRDGGKTLAAAKIACGYEEETTEDPQETYYGQLCRAWNQSDEKTKLRFLNLIDAAIVGSAETMTPEMRRALDALPSSTAPSRGGRKPGKGAR